MLRSIMSQQKSRLELPATLSASLEAGHPWVYRDRVPRGFSAPDGALLRVRAGSYSGWGLWDASSPIALRMLSHREEPTAAWLRTRVAEAWELRALVRSEDTNAYRLVFGEGDGLPGITVDLYDTTCVVITYADGLARLLDWLVVALRDIAPIERVVRRRRGRDHDRLELLWGSPVPGEIVVRENGMRLRVDLERGQKTGLFLDHRDNRSLVKRLAAGRRVLNLFSYTGAFSLAAALGGAEHVTSVDVSAGAMAAARQNFADNGLDPNAHEFLVRDVFEHLAEARGRGQRFDLVVSDPPSFANSRGQLKTALKAYRKLTADGLRVVRSGGLYAAASCTAQVSPEAFKSVIAEAAARVNRRFQIVHEAAHAFDHPVMIAHPEGRYLKLVLGRVLENS